MSATIKLRGDDRLDILAIPYGGPFNGKDADKEYFTERTDLCLDWFPDRRPMLFHHGLDARLKADVVGYVDTTTARKAVDGVWVQGQLNKSSAYYDDIRTLLDHGALHGSTGAMPHLVKKSPTGEITRWPWVEQSLTPTPANLFSIVAPAEAAKHFADAGIPDGIKALQDIAIRHELPSNWLTGEMAGKAGRTLSAANEAKIRHAQADLEKLLSALGA